MKNKSISMLFLMLLVIIPIRGCKNEVISPSIVEFDCRKNPIEKLVPGTPGITLAATRCEDYTYDDKKFSKAIFIFAEEYAEAFDLHPSEVLRKLSNLRVQVSLIPRVVSAAYDINGNFLQKNVPVNGLALDKDNIWVEIKTSKIYHSALIHELVHIMIWRDNIIHGDPDHEGEKFSGWTEAHTRVIKTVNNKLLDLDI